MPTVQQILKDSGFTDEQISQLDNRAITAFGGVLSTAEAAQQRAELERRSNAEFYDNSIVPSLTAWDEEKQRYDANNARIAAENAYYKTQAEAAGITIPDPPGYQGRDGQGRYVTNAPGSTPGSPTYMNFDVNKVYERAGDAISVLTDVQWEHQRLFGQPLPISPSELIKQADAHRMEPRAYASRTFNWEQKKQEQEAVRQKQHDDQIRADERRIVSEKLGSNPDIRLPQASRFADVQRAQKQGLVPDPLSLNEGQRRAATAAMIRNDMRENEADK